MRTAAKILGALAAALLLFLLVGILLPGRWEAEAELQIQASPQKVYGVLNAPETWESWAAIPEQGTEVYGPSRGVGAGIRWNDPQYGSGQMEIRASRQDEVVEYAVVVEDGAIRIDGLLRLEPNGGGTRVRWREEGDFGWNPLLGYTARGMGRSQSAALAAGLERLNRVLEETGSGSRGG